MGDGALGARPLLTVARRLTRRAIGTSPVGEAGVAYGIEPSMAVFGGAAVGDLGGGTDGNAALPSDRRRSKLAPRSELGGEVDGAVGGLTGGKRGAAREPRLPIELFKPKAVGGGGPPPQALWSLSSSGSSKTGAVGPNLLLNVEVGLGFERK
jgi:hypothetical protein